MALSYPLRGYAGGASAGSTNTALPVTKTSGTFSSSTSLTGWADVTGNNFTGEYLCLSFGYGTASEEKILVTFDNVNTFTIQARGYDGTTPQNWSVGASFVLVATASELAEANDAVQALKTILTNNGTTTAPQPIAYSSTTAGSAGTGQTPAAIDHSHNISASTLNSWLVGGASGTVGSGVAIPYSQVTGTPTLPASDAQVSSTPVSITTSYPTTAGSGLLPSPVNPNGTFAKYSWEALATVNGASPSTVQANAVLMYRVAGSGSSWTQVSLVAGVMTGYGRLVASGVLSAPVAGTDYEFQLGFTVASGSQSLYFFSLKVIGTN